MVKAVETLSGPPNVTLRFYKPEFFRAMQNCLLRCEATARAAVARAEGTKAAKRRIVRKAAAVVPKKDFASYERKGCGCAERHWRERGGNQNGFQNAYQNGNEPDYASVAETTANPARGIAVTVRDYKSAAGKVVLTAFCTRVDDDDGPDGGGDDDDGHGDEGGKGEEEEEARVIAARRTKKRPRTDGDGGGGGGGGPPSPPPAAA